MKFLCVPCDSPMTLQTVAPPDRGSLAVRYACPECGYEIAMLTNAYETQVVQSLGVRIGPAEALAKAGASASRASASVDTDAAGGTCPFSAMIPASAKATAGRPATAKATAGKPATANATADEPLSVRWTAAAEARLTNIPEFVRPMARTGIERFARERGVLEVDETTLDAAREFFGM